MRIALITLALTALAFIGSIIYSMAGGSEKLVNNQTLGAKISTDTPVDMENLKYNIKITEKLDELTTKIEKLEKLSQGGSSSSSAMIHPESVGTGQIIQPENTNIIPISGKFLSKVMPTMELILAENKGIFDLHVFDSGTNYSTYNDTKTETSIIVTSMTYNVFLANAKALGKEVYSINETKTFPFRSFYLNPPKADNTVRIVMEIESQAIAVQIPKAKFPAFKALLLKK